MNLDAHVTVKLIEVEIRFSLFRMSFLVTQKSIYPYPLNVHEHGKINACRAAPSGIFHHSSFACRPIIL